MRLPSTWLLSVEADAAWRLRCRTTAWHRLIAPSLHRVERGNLARIATADDLVPRLTYGNYERKQAA